LREPGTGGKNLLRVSQQAAFDDLRTGRAALDAICACGPANAPTRAAAARAPRKSAN